MNILALGAVFIVMTTVVAWGDDVPFAMPHPPAPNQPDTSDLVSLGDIMVATQLRHIKLWYAGEEKNWGLVNYEIDRITESLSRAAVLYTNIPVKYLKSAAGPLDLMREAVATKNSGAFVRGYSELTAACNGCHSAAHVGFLRIQTPTSSPFSDESYGK